MKTHPVFDHHWLLLHALDSDLLFSKCTCSLWLGCTGFSDIKLVKVKLLDDTLLSICVAALLYGIKSSFADPSCVDPKYS